MNDHAKRFFRVLTHVGLLTGCLWAILVTFERGLKSGIIWGIVFGLLVGLSVAYFQTKEFSKPIYTMNIRVDDLPGGTIQSEFHLRDIPYMKILLWFGLLCVLLLYYVLNTPVSNGIFSTLFFTILMAFSITLKAIQITFTKLIIGPDGVKLVSVIYTLHIRWENVQQIERRGKCWYMICHSSKLSTLPIFTRWLRYLEVDKIISLDGFNKNFWGSELQKSILHYGEQVKFVSRRQGMGFSEKLMDQGGKPSGLLGRCIGFLMNLNHSGVYKWGLGAISPASNATVLDIGCGGGEAVKLLAMNCPEGKIYGLDHSPEMVSLASKVNQAFVEKNRVQIDYGSVSALPYSDCLFDIVTAFETIQFWKNLDADLKEVLRVLKPTGKLLIVNRYPDLEGRNANWAEFLQIRSSKEYHERLSHAGYGDISTDIASKAGWILVSARKP